MAPWAQRFNTNASTSNSAPAAATLDLNRPLPPPPSTAADYEIPTLRRKAVSDAADGSPLGHNRSFSHPFPSLFGSGRKSDKKSTLRAETNSIFDTTDDDISIHDEPTRSKVTKT